MGTSNFGWENMLIAIIPKNDDSEWVIDDAIECIKDDFIDTLDFNESHGYEDGSNGGRLLCSKDIETSRGVYARVTLVVRSGYYEGINFDYTVDYIDDFEGLKTKTLDKKLATLCKQVHKLAKNHGTELQVSARFSNGETWYTKK